MANRLTKIVTRTGDDGTTGLGNGARVGKDSARIQALGDLDELNSALGWVIAEAPSQRMQAMFTTIQNDLFDLGGEISIPGRAALWDAHVEQLERIVECLREPLPTLKEFILPGGSRAAAACHLARAICRRAERSIVALGRVETVSDLSIRYMNRLSDVLFLAARTLNVEAGHPETLWNPGREKKA